MASKYDRGRALGEGTYALVYEAFRKTDRLPVAIKRMKGEQAVSPGVDFTGLREVKYLRMLSESVNVVNLVDVFLTNDVLCLVLEFCPYNLEDIIRDKSILLRTQHQKCYLKMLLRGVDSCHAHYVLHRDLKPANILFSLSGELKIADFGLARTHSSPIKMTSEIATRWYRPPELLFGACFYSSGIDMWGVGCIFAEIILRTPFFPGETDLEQLAKIFNILGTPTSDNWPYVQLLPNFVEFEPRLPMDLIPLFDSTWKADKQRHGQLQYPPALDLMLKMLTLNPLKRITAKDVRATCHSATILYHRRIMTSIVDAYFVASFHLLTMRAFLCTTTQIVIFINLTVYFACLILYYFILTIFIGFIASILLHRTARM